MSQVSSPGPSSAPGRLRTTIAESWRRARMAGVDPTTAFASLQPAEVDGSSSLMVAADPVLAQLDEELSGSGYSTILGDRECRVVRRWFDDARTHDGFDELNIREGACLLEETVGTNGLGTVFETRHPVTVNGAEHYVSALQRFSCYGHPIRHPLTKRIEGVLDVSALLETASPLIPPLIARAVADIEARLLGGARSSEKSLLTAFQEASGHRRRAVVAIGDDIVMSNQVASGLLSASDVAVLQVLAREPLRRHETTIELTLESGRAVQVRLSPVRGAHRGALVRVDPRSTSTTAWASRRTTSPSTERPGDGARPPVLIAGPPGSGRTTSALRHCVEPVTVMRASEALVDGVDVWARAFARALTVVPGSVCIDPIDLLPEALLDLVVQAVDRPERPDLVLVSGPVGGLTGLASELAGTAATREELQPLSARPGDVPELARQILAALAHDDPAVDESVHLTPGAIRALTAQSWPGNLRELRAALARATSVRSSGGITVGDLPEQYRCEAPATPLAALDRAERDVIVTALRDAGGNKVRAARELGVSRTTLYSMIRRLRITGY